MKRTLLIVINSALLICILFIKVFVNRESNKNTETKNNYKLKNSLIDHGCSQLEFFNTFFLQDENCQIK